MTSGTFTSLPLDSITIERDDRQRKEFKEINALTESIRRIGLINPLVVTRDNVLVAGESRYLAVKELGHETVAVQYTDELEPSELYLIEMEENLKRTDLTWQEQCTAFKKLHAMYQEKHEDWTLEKTCVEVNIDYRTGLRWLSIADEIDSGNTAVIEAPKASVALSIIDRKNNREKGDEAILANRMLAEMLGEKVPTVKTTAEVKELEESAPVSDEPLARAPILNVEFAHWLDSVEVVEPFNLIHCDFPYGVNFQDSDQSARFEYGSYEDSADVYWDLLGTLKKAMPKIVAPNAHMIFWFSMDYYAKTKELLEAMGWKVSPFPLVWWKSDNKGIAPDAKRQPRRVYETAFHCVRGDRFIAKMKSNLVSAANVKTMHVSEKPVDMLSHFMEMYVDETTVMLDPTAGSCNALRAAHLAGAKSVLGLERDESFHEAAVEKWHKYED
jgi:ParB family chromosome partitioning protein